MNCKNCGASKFIIKNNLYKCEYCKSVFKNDEVKDNREEKKHEEIEKGDYQIEEIKIHDMCTMPGFLIVFKLKKMPSVEMYGIQDITPKEIEDKHYELCYATQNIPSMYTTFHNLKIDYKNKGINLYVSDRAKGMFNEQIKLRRIKSIFDMG